METNELYLLDMLTLSECELYETIEEWLHEEPDDYQIMMDLIVASN